MGLDLQSEKEMKYKVLIKNHIALHPKKEEERKGEIWLVVKCIKSDENKSRVVYADFSRGYPKWYENHWCLWAWKPTQLE